MSSDDIRKEKNLDEDTSVTEFREYVPPPRHPRDETQRVNLIPSDEDNTPLPDDHSDHYDDACRLTVKESTRYQVDKLIARGAMGTVYAVKDISCDRTIALKVISSKNHHDEEESERFVQEAQITSRLEHPNIIPVHELGNISDGNLFYTMKHVKGVSMSEILKGLRDGNEEIIKTYPLQRLLTIFQKVCDAVAFAHSRNIIHCDLKPANVMIGAYGEVLVLDWGLARELLAPGQVPSATQARLRPTIPPPPQDPSVGLTETTRIPVSSLYTDELNETMTVEVMDLNTDKTELKTEKGTVIGTPGFMAPELITSVGAAYSEQTDIYSLGGILYLILTLQPPVKGDNLKDLISRIVSSEIIPPIAYNHPERFPAKDLYGPRGSHKPLRHCPAEKIPTALSDIAIKALASDPSERHESVQELQREIEDFQNGLVWHPVLDEDFSEPDKVMKNWTVLGGKFEIKPGELRLYGGEPQLLLFNSDISGDLRIDFECHIESEYLNDIACLLNTVRSRDPWTVSVSGYAFKYGAYTNSFNALTRLDKKMYMEADTPLARFRKFNVRAERVGNELRMWVNNREIFTVYDPEPLSGAHRSCVGLLGWIADVRYSRIRIYSLGTPWKCDLLDAAQRHLERGHYITAMDLFQDVLDSFPDEERISQAREGMRIAKHCKQLVALLPEWQTRLEAAWPNIPVKMRIENNGLTVELPSAGITNLEPLRGMPIKALHCTVNRIKSLEPLRGMPLTTLNCSGNPIENLEPLRGMKLELLLCEYGQIPSLEPLQGMPLITLNCTSNPLQNGITALKDSSLSWLSCGRCQVESLEALRGQPLTQLFCEGNLIRDLSPLTGMPLTELICPGNEIEDLTPLIGMPLNNVNIGCNRIKSLEPLRDMPLSTFRCPNNLIEAFDPLHGMALNYMMCGGNRVTSIDPLLESPPQQLAFACDTISDEQLNQIRRRCLSDPRLGAFAQDTETILAVRQRDVAKLREMAQVFEGHHFLYIPIMLPWKPAQDLCEELGGHLVTITSEEKNRFIATLFPLGGAWFWIGLYTHEDGHQWVTKEPFDYRIFCHVLDESSVGPKVFASGKWRNDMIPDAWNCFVIEWDD